MKTLITILFARLVKKRNNKWISNPLETQAKTFNKLLLKGTNTEFGKDHNFSTIKNYEDFTKQIDYFIENYNENLEKIKIEAGNLTISEKLVDELIK